MSSLQFQTWIYGAIMLLAGIGIPVMATLNAGLGMRLQSPPLASSILLFIGFLSIATFTLFTEGIPNTLHRAPTPFYFYLAGFCVAFYLVSIAWIGPRFGIGNAVAFVLLGQLIAMTLIDQFGWFGAPQITISLQRLLGLVFMLVGVILVVKTS